MQCDYAIKMAETMAQAFGVPARFSAAFSDSLFRTRECGFYANSVADKWRKVTSLALSLRPQRAQCRARELAS